MEKWEEIIKDTLKDSKESLPEDDFALFQSKLEASKSNKAKLIPFAKIAKVAIPALAACAAGAVILINGGKNNSTSDDIVNVLDSAPVIAETISPEVESDPLTSINDIDVAPKSIASNFKPSSVKKMTAMTSQVDEIVPETADAGIETVEMVSEEIPQNENSQVKLDEDSSLEDVQKTQNKETVNEIIRNTSTVQTNPIGGNEPIVRSRRGNSIVPVIGGVSGGALAALFTTAALAPASGSWGAMDAKAPIYDSELGYYPSYDSGSSFNEVIADYKTMMPLKVGLTARYNISNKLYLVSGLEYSLYSTKIEYNAYPSQKQYAHYIGIPVRLDWNMISAGKFDFYLGAGAEADFCMAAKVDGESLDEKDKPIFSLVGATGVQYNFCRRLGVYLEPQLSYGLNTKNQTLHTYRSEHSAMFSGTIGLRLNL